ncbi:hypothetical protein D9M71_762980 [compost metagenome]
MKLPKIAATCASTGITTDTTRQKTMMPTNIRPTFSQTIAMSPEKPSKVVPSECMSAISMNKPT